MRGRLRTPIPIGRSIVAWGVAAWTAAVAAPALDADLQAGGRADPAGAAFAAGGSLDARAASGPFAARLSASADLFIGPGAPFGGDAAVDAGGSFAADGVVGGAYCFAGTTDAGGPRVARAGVRLPVSFNGLEASFSFEPEASFLFLGDESFSLGGRASASFLAGDFVLSPAGRISFEFFRDGSRAAELLPSLGAEWYPGVPVSADFRAGWTVRWDSAGSRSDSVPLGLSFFAVPVPFVACGLSCGLSLGAAGAESWEAEAAVELSPARASGPSPFFPAAFRTNWTAADGYSWSAVLAAGLRLGP